MRRLQRAVSHALICLLVCTGGLVVSSEVQAAPKTKVSVSGKRGSMKVKCSYNKRRGRWKLIRNSRTIAKLKKKKIKVKKAKKACGTLVARNAVTGLDALPGVGEIANSRGSARIRLADVIGTPPKLVDIPSLDIPNLFWNDGVVDRIASSSATPDDCNQFFGGNNDGESAGYAGCFMSMATGEIMQEAVRAGTSVCYMRSFPAVGPAGGVTITSGSENLPDGDGARIFETPDGSSPRLVKVQIENFPFEEGPSDIFIQVSSSDTNTANKDQYAYRMWFCDGGIASATESGRVRNNGKMTLSAESNDVYSSYKISLDAYLVEEDGELTYNPNLDRELNVMYSAPGDDGFRGRAVFTADNEIKTKSYHSSEGLRSYGVMAFQGNDTGDVRFRAGGYKDMKEGSDGNDFRVGVEYRSDRYVAAPSSSKVNALKKVNLATDPFYQDESLTFDPDAYDCGAVPDVTVSLDFSNPALVAVSQDCESGALDNMDFCSHSDVQAAESNYVTACSGS